MQRKFNNNSKEISEQIQAYLLDAIDVSDYSPKDTSLKTSLTIIVDEFNDWLTPHQLRSSETHQKAFYDYLMCVPGCLNVTVWDSEAIELLKQWNVTTPANDDEFFTQTVELFYSLVYREFAKLCKEYKVGFSPTVKF